MPKIIRFHETGGADVLQIEGLPLEEPSEGEVRLKVEAIGLNRAEVMFRDGHKLKLQGGIQFADMRDRANDGGAYSGVAGPSGFRMSW